MGETVTFRLDSETESILNDLVRREKRARSEVIRDALRARWNSVHEETRPTFWEVYKTLKIPPAVSHRDRARHVSRLLKEKLVAKRRDGTL
jgi:Arc/MetJ-type ribon-helix-helix transcriptional regulator